MSQTNEVSPWAPLSRLLTAGALIVREPTPRGRPVALHA